MIGLDLPIDRVLEYARRLSPEQRAILLAEFDRKRLLGEEVSESDPMVRALRRMVRSSKVGAPRIPSPSRLFFDPVEPFIVDDVPRQPRRGRIARASFAAIWSWICRDAMPAEARKYSDRAKSAVLAGGMRTAAQLASNFQDRVLVRIGHAPTLVGAADDIRERLVAYGGPRRALDDLQEIFRIFKVRDELAGAAAALPTDLANLREDAAQQAWRTLDPLCAEQHDAWFYALLILMSRLGAPWQLIRLAIAAAQSNSATRIAESPYGVAVSLVLQDVEDLAGRLRIALASGWSAANDETLWDLHEAIAGLSTELDFTGEPRWSRQLARLRDGVSQLFRVELAGVPKRIARLLAPRTVAAARHGTAPPAIEVDAATGGIALAVALEPHVGEFDLGADIARMRADATVELERATAALLDRVRGGCDVERVNCLLRVEVAARLADKLRGQDFAAVIVRAAEAAVDGTRAAAGPPRPA